MKKIISKKVAALVMAVSAVATSVVMPVSASDDNHGYSFSVGAYYGNGYSSERYRQTTNTNNKWKVDMTYSSEGQGTKITYWLAKSSDKATASDFHDVKQGSGAQYYKALKNASETHVVLAAENNNYDASSYSVSGYWDEETN